MSRRKPSDCIACGHCSAACTNRIAVNQQMSVSSPECSGSMDCTLVCPVPGVRQMETRPPASRTLKPTKLGAAIALLSVGLVYLAQISGRWQSRLSESDFRVGLMMMEVRGMNVHKTGRQNLPTQ